jgi:hypothetical protein
LRPEKPRLLRTFLVLSRLSGLVLSLVISLGPLFVLRVVVALVYVF